MHNDTPSPAHPICRQSKPKPSLMIEVEPSKHPRRQARAILLCHLCINQVVQVGGVSLTSQGKVEATEAHIMKPNDPGPAHGKLVRTVVVLTIPHGIYNGVIA